MEGYDVKNVQGFGGTIARPVVQWETLQERNDKSEQAHQRDNEQFTALGFAWDAEMLGFYHSAPDAQLPE